MLTSIRKVQKSLLIVVTIVICVAFAYFYAKSDAGVSGNASLSLEVNGKTYRRADAVKLANSFYVAFADLGQVSMFNFSPLGEFALTLFGQERMDRDRTNYVVNLIVLRQAAEDMGIDATAEEIDQVILELPAFQDPGTGAFSRARYDDYIRTRLGRYSMVETDLRQLIGDYVKFRKLRELLGSGMRPAPWEIDQAYEERYEAFTVDEFFLPDDEVPEPGEPSEEAIQEYFENNEGKPKLRTEPRRGLKFVAFPLPERGEEEAPDEWRPKRLEVAKRFNAVFRAVTDAMEEEGMTIEEALAQQEGLEVQSGGEPFPRSAVPGTLVTEVALTNQLFEMPPEATGRLAAAETQKAIYLFWMDEFVESRPLTLEEAREKIATILKTQEEEGALQAAATERRKELAEKLRAGTEPTAAAEEVGLQHRALEPFTRMEIPDGTDFGTTLRSMVYDLAEKEVSQPRLLPDGALLAWVEKREVPERESEPEDRKMLADSLRAARASQAYTAWFREQRQAAKAKFPLMRNTDGQMVPVSIEQLAGS